MILIESLFLPYIISLLMGKMYYLSLNLMLKRTISILLLALALSACTSSILKESKANYDQGNYESSMQKLMPLAQKGNPAAQYAVGYMMYYGKGTAVNKKEAIEWINKAAEQGQTEAIQAQAMLQKQKPKNPLKTH